jgi:hypothetical protein
MADQPAEQWNERTPAESLSAMRRALNANTEKANAAADWAQRTYQLISPLVKRQDELERRVLRLETRGYRWPLLAASIAAAIASISLACEVLK